MSVIYIDDNLNDLQWLGERVFDFLKQWENVIENLAVPIGEDAKRDLLFKKIERSPLFAADLNHYKREKAKSLMRGSNTEEYSLTFLLSILRRHCAEDREEKIVEASRQSVLGGGNTNNNQRNLQNAAPATTKGAASPAVPATADPKTARGNHETSPERRTRNSSRMNRCLNS